MIWFDKKARSTGDDRWKPFTSCLASEEGGAVIYIDDEELSLEEFGKALTVFAGWGMRIVFVPDDELENEPRIEIREPQEE